jgi:hypothetical protein
VSVAAGESRRIEIDRNSASGDLEVAVDFIGGATLPDPTPLLRNLDATATWSTPEDSIVAVDAWESFDGKRLTAVWRGLTRGKYLVQLGDLLFPVSVLPGSNSRHSFEVSGRTRRSVFVVDAETGVPVDIHFLQWSWLAEDTGIPSGVLLPPGGTASVEGGVWEAWLPAGHLRMYLVTSSGAHYWSGDLTDTDDSTVLEVTPTFECVLARSGIASGEGLTFGYLRDVQFSRADAPVDPEDVLIAPGRSHDSNPRVRAVLTVKGGRPERVYIPPLDSIASGGWIRLPEGRRRVTIDLETGIAE